MPVATGRSGPTLGPYGGYPPATMFVIQARSAALLLLHIGQ